MSRRDCTRSNPNPRPSVRFKVFTGVSVAICYHTVSTNFQYPLSMCSFTAVDGGVPGCSLSLVVAPS